MSTTHACKEFYQELETRITLPEGTTFKEWFLINHPHDKIKEKNYCEKHLRELRSGNLLATGAVKALVYMKKSDSTSTKGGKRLKKNKRRTHKKKTNRKSKRSRKRRSTRKK